MCDGGVDLLEIGRVSHRPDHRGARPAGELGGKFADAAEHAVDQDRLAFDGTVAEDCPVRRDARDAEAGTKFVTDLVWQLDGKARTSPSSGSGVGMSPAMRT